MIFFTSFSYFFEPINGQVNCQGKFIFYFQEKIRIYILLIRLKEIIDGLLMVYWWIGEDSMLLFGSVIWMRNNVISNHEENYKKRQYT